MSEEQANTTPDLTFHAKSGDAKKQLRDDQAECSSSVEITRSFGASLADAVQTFGEAEVFSLFRAQAVVKCQAAMRGAMLVTSEDGTFQHDDEAVRNIGKDFTPALQRRASGGRQSKTDQILKALAAGATPEEILAKFGT